MSSRRGGILAGLVLASALALPRPVAGGVGDTSSYTWNICGGEATFSLCASVAVTYTETLTGGHIDMTVTNLSDAPYNPTGPNSSMFTKIAFFNLGGATVTSVGLLTPPVTGWESSTSLSSSGGQAVVFGVQTTHGINNAIPTGPGNSLSFSFDFTGTNLNLFAASLAAGTVGLSIHAQGGPNGYSSTCLTAGKNENCGGTTIPEPATLLLMGTGMAGIAAVRRRRRLSVEGDDA